MAFALAMGVSSPESVAAKPPNVLIILTDDQGWGDLSLHGNRDLSTPHIDSIARDGAAFQHFYVSPVCSPTRAEFLTGRYHPRSGVTGVTSGSERMNMGEATIAEHFRKAGYATGCFGKWHNGMQYPYHPRARGFDVFFGFCSGHWGDYFDPEMEQDGTYISTKGYITDIFTNEAIRFMENNRDRPFFCYLPLCTPHSPMQVPDEYWMRHRDKPLLMDHPQSDAHTRAALAMVENVDDNVGRLLAKLEELKIGQDTIVLYFSDNGPNGERWNGGMRGIKGSLDEGGLRVPLLARWVGKIQPGTQVREIAAAIDLLPTLSELCGVAITGGQPLDGMSLSHRLLRPSEAPSISLSTRAIFSSHHGKVSVRTAGYRLDAKGRLYDMIHDPGQRSDITLAEKEVANRLREQADEWRKTVGLDLPQPQRPFPIGHPDWALAELPARDARAIGGLKRSSVHPNCSYFLNWKHTDDGLEWPVRVLTAGRYEIVVHYACPLEDIGSTMELRFGKAVARSTIRMAHDAPLQGGDESRSDRGESLVKEFKPWVMGSIDLPAGDGMLTLKARDIPGGQAMEFRRLFLRRIDP